VRAELRALVGVEAAHEQRAEDGRLHGGPIQPAHLGQDVQAIAVQVERAGVVEQAAVHQRDFVRAE